MAEALFFTFYSMRIFSFLFAFLLGMLALSSITSAAETAVCTREYAPVCAQPPMPQCPAGMACIEMMPVPTTYSNSCMMRAAGASLIHEGACESLTVPPIVWGDVDKYGCKPSTGYSWNSVLRECVRPWMTKTRILTVLGDMVPCTGVGPMQCLQVKRGNKIELMYSSIAGFTPVSGYTYRLLVREEKVENPPADASSVTYKLVRTLSKRMTQPQVSTIVGTWKLDAYFTGDVGYPMEGKYTLSLMRDSYSVQFCNVINGQYTTTNSLISSPYAMSTKMACLDDTKNMLETHWQPDGATYTLSTDRTRLSIKMKNGATYTFTK